VHFPVRPKGAFDVASDASAPVPVWRYDAALKVLVGGEPYLFDAQIASTSALVVTLSAARLADPEAWLATVAEGYQYRVRRVEVDWFPVAACGQVSFPRFEEAIALVQLEWAVLRDAYVAKEPTVVEQHLREWYAIRKKAFDSTILLAKRARHYDNEYGNLLFARRRFLAVDGRVSRAELAAAYVAGLEKVWTVPITEFDAFMLANGTPGAAPSFATRTLGATIAVSGDAGEQA